MDKDSTDKPRSMIDHARVERFRIATLRMAWAKGEQPSTDTYGLSHPFDRTTVPKEPTP